MKNKGFTFIELIIALTIFAIIALGIYSTFSTGLNTWRRGEDANRLEQEARWALDKMAKELQDAIIYNYGQSYPDTQLFLGEKDKISFLTLTYSFSTKLSEIKRITYSLEVPEYGTIYKTQMGTRGKRPSRILAHYGQSEASLNSLQRKEETLVQSLQSQEQSSIKSEALTSLVKSDGLLFSYAFKEMEEAGETITWKEKWEDSAKLPKGIKITLILQNPKNPAEEAIFTKTIFLERGELG